jgi:TolB-like protein
MTRPRSLAALLLLCCAAAPAPARAEEVAAAAERVAASLADQLSRKPLKPGAVIAVAPARESAAAQPSGAGRAFGERLQVELGRLGRFALRDWQAVDGAARERLLAAVAGGALALPPVPEVDALVVVEASGGEGAVKVAVRVVALPVGLVLASETARLDQARTGAPPARTEGVDVAMRRLGDMLASGLSRLPGGARYQRLAVLPLGEVGPEARKRELGAVVTAELSTTLRRDHGLLLVERARLGSLLAEVKLGEMGLVDPGDAPKLGRLSDAQALVMGSVADAGDRFLVNARIVATESGETLATASESISAGSLIALSSEAVVLRSRKDAVYRSLLLPGWGQAYNRQGGKAVAFGVAAAGTLGAALAFHLAGQRAQDDYQSKVTAGQLGGDPSGQAAALRAEAVDNYQRRNAFLIGAGAVWAVGVVDAYLFGVDGEKAADGLALGLAAEGMGMAVAWRF